MAEGTSSTEKYEPLPLVEGDHEPGLVSGISAIVGDCCEVATGVRVVEPPDYLPASDEQHQIRLLMHPALGVLPVAPEGRADALVRVIRVEDVHPVPVGRPELGEVHNRPRSLLELPPQRS